jgi:hypothetical protein
MTNDTLPEAFDEVINEINHTPTPVFHKNHETGTKSFARCFTRSRSPRAS